MVNVIGNGQKLLAQHLTPTDPVQPRQRDRDVIQAVPGPMRALPSPRATGAAVLDQGGREAERLDGEQLVELASRKVLFFLTNGANERTLRMAEARVGVNQQEE